MSKKTNINFVVSIIRLNVNQTLKQCEKLRKPFVAHVVV